MKRTPGLVSVGLLLFAPSTGAAQESALIPTDSICSYTTQFVDTCFTVHGRLYAANGGPAARVWVIGTKRILGIDQACEFLPLLERLLFVDDKVVYADFVVRPLTVDRPGHMRRVCVAAVSRIVTRPAYFMQPPPR